MPGFNHRRLLPPSAMIALFGESKNKEGINLQQSPPDNLTAKREESQELPPPIPTFTMETFWTQILEARPICNNAITATEYLITHISRHKLRRRNHTR